MKSKAQLALFLIIMLEGYVVLSTELLAIRLMIPFIGSGTDTVSIIIAAVLMPLSLGYYNGGRFRERVKNLPVRERSIRRRLVLNMLVSSLILLPGLSYYFLMLTVGVMIDAGFDNRLALATLYSAVFIVTPVYLLGQTIPLIMHYFSAEQSARITGRVLSLSTLGSFMGAIFCTLVLMAYIGVHNAAAVNLVLLAAMMTVLAKKKMSGTVLAGWAAAAMAIHLNSGAMMQNLFVVSNNQYNTTAIYTDEDGARHLVQNNNDSSLFDDKGTKHPYIQFLEKVALDPIRKDASPKKILIIGAGGFTFGKGELVHDYTYLDIDPALKEISEKFFLKEELEPNKTFKPVEARAYLAGTEEKYDLILLDAYYGRLSVPEHLVTRDFLTQVKSRLKPGGAVMFNFILSPNFRSAISRNIDNTLRSVFPHVSRHAIKDDYLLWSDDKKALINIIYLYRDGPADSDVYTDDKNKVYYDMP